MKTVDVLIKARELVSDSSIKGNGWSGKLAGWTTHAVYRDENGTPHWKREGARCFCSVGAILGALDLDVTDQQYGLSVNDRKENPVFLRAVKYLSKAYETLGLGSDARRERAAGEVALACLMGIRVHELWRIVRANDNEAGHGQVLQAFDLAIKRARRRHPNGDKSKTRRNASIQAA